MYLSAGKTVHSHSTIIPKPRGVFDIMPDLLAGLKDYVREPRACKDKDFISTLHR